MVFIVGDAGVLALGKDVDIPFAVLDREVTVVGFVAGVLDGGNADWLVIERYQLLFLSGIPEYARVSVEIICIAV